MTAAVPSAIGAAENRVGERLEAETAPHAAGAAAPPPVPAAPAPVPMTQAAARSAGSLVLRARGTPVLWRAAGPGVIERSSDAGVSWQPQVLGTSVVPTAGAALSASLCWLVGPEGTVLLSTDGLTWRLLEPPSAADLVAVVAQDARIATVRAADGRAFRTTDAGATWAVSR